jgi:hypothetical protein
MNRREAMAALTSLAGGVGTVKAIEAEPKPLLLVLTMAGDGDTDTSAAGRILESWEEFRLRHGLPPLVINPAGWELKAVVDPRET